MLLLLTMTLVSKTSFPSGEMDFGSALKIYRHVLLLTEVIIVSDHKATLEDLDVTMMDDIF